MGVISDRMRSRANEFVAGLETIFNTKPVDRDLVAAVKAAVVPELLLAMADMLQVLEQNDPAETRYSRLQQIVRRNQAIRLAAANGDWNELDRIIAGEPPGDAGADATEGAGS